MTKRTLLIIIALLVIVDIVAAFWYLSARLEASGVGFDIFNMNDDRMVTAAILGMKAKGCDVIVCTGGMSVDPDDRTPLAIKNTGARIVTYGAPLLPGAMFLLAYLDGTPVMGLPGCVMYAASTVFDVILPRIVAGDEVTADELADLGEGGLCLGCPDCRFPDCGFGK